MKQLDGLASKDDKIVEFWIWFTFWKNVLETMYDNVIISEVDALIYVVLSEAENACLMGN
jgi:hypothetical protein